ncbi:MAG: 2-oxo acid dehydrogenase subunit E2, partial [Melioribacteraceae bacterium]|nr:2-oxo acid dehydrogenase subunit E2 [Melioribacteraceae bacterium]
PVLGENIKSADILKILVAEGDKVEKDQIVLELETDKATMEVPIEESGTITKILLKEGTKANIGEAVFTYEPGSGAESDDNSDSRESSDSATSDAVKSSSSTKAADSSGDSKSAMEESKRDTGAKPKEDSGAKAKDSATKDDLSKSKDTPKKDGTDADLITPLSAKVMEMPDKIAPASPSVRRFSREIGIDIHQVRASGNGGRITIEDVKAYAKSLNEMISSGGAVASGGGGSFYKETLPDFTKWGDIEKQPMSNIRRKTAEHLSYAWQTIPHVTQFDKADITELEKIRKQFGKKAEEAGGKLTVTAILIKVIASALKVFPQFNSSIDMEKNEIIYKKYFNIGIAVDTERGLLVPVVRDADKKNVIQIAADLAEISKKARDKKLSLDDMQGGSISISNLGGIAGTYFTPIVNAPEVAILGVSRSAMEPVYIDGKFEPRLMMPLSLSYDHRIIDGADAARFIKWVVDALEQPFLLTLEG